jgi:hypothetical protein
VRKRGKVKSTKTGVSRRIPIEAELYPLLRTLHEESGGNGKVIATMPSPGMLSRKLKLYLRKAGSPERSSSPRTRRARRSRSTISEPQGLHGRLRAATIRSAVGKGRGTHLSPQRKAISARRRTSARASEGSSRPCRSSPGLLPRFRPGTITSVMIQPKNRGTGWAQQDLK